MVAMTFPLSRSFPKRPETGSAGTPVLPVFPASPIGDGITGTGTGNGGGTHVALTRRLFPTGASAVRPMGKTSPWENFSPGDGAEGPCPEGAGAKKASMTTTSRMSLWGASHD